MPPINIDISIPRVGPPDPNPAQHPRRTAGRAQPPRSRADNASSSAKPITGKVYALKDGSGYVALASDGSYYRVDADSGHGLAFSRAGGFVDASMVDVVGGPVSTVEADPDPGTGSVDAALIGPNRARDSRDERTEVQLPGSGHRADRK